MHNYSIVKWGDHQLAKWLHKHGWTDIVEKVGKFNNFYANGSLIAIVEYNGPGGVVSKVLVRNDLLSEKEREIMSVYRFVLCVDVDSETLPEAYEILSKEMGKTNLAWETSDEWYKENSNDPGDEKELQSAITYFLLKEGETK